MQRGTWTRKDAFRGCRKSETEDSKDQRMQWCSREWIVRKCSERDLFDRENTMARREGEEGWGLRVERTVTFRDGGKEGAFCRGIMRARLIVPLLMFARFRASFSSGHFSWIRASPGFAWLITINKYPALARDTAHREKEITSCRGFCYNHSARRPSSPVSIPRREEGATAV